MRRFLQGSSRKKYPLQQVQDKIYEDIIYDVCLTALTERDIGSV